MNIIKRLFNGRNVEMQQDDSGTLWFEVESLSMAIGYITKAKGKELIFQRLYKVYNSGLQNSRCMIS